MPNTKFQQYKVDEMIQLKKKLKAVENDPKNF